VIFCNEDVPPVFPEIARKKGLGMEDALTVAITVEPRMRHVRYPP
jgi:hypothetical protein